MTFVTPRQFCEALYCASAPCDAFVSDPDGRIAFAAHVDSRGVRSRFEVVFAGVRGLTSRPPAPEHVGLGDYLELSVIELERESDGWRVWFNPWYLTEIEFRCHRILLNGAEVRGEGRWLQDTLPTPSPV